MHYVIDCSFSSALFLPDENSEDVRKLFLNINKKNNQIFIPLLWWYETSNVLNISIKRKRISYSDAKLIINLFHKIHFQTDTEHGLELSNRLLELSQLYQISSYDAAYLDLAIRKKAKLLTLDNALKRVALEVGVKLN